MELIAARTFNSLYIYLDIIWLVIYILVLIITKRHLAILAGIAGGLIYFLVDYGIFYQALGSRVIEGADPFWFLLWLSFSYGLTNFSWIWLLLDRDRFSVEWSLLPIIGWIAVALLSQNLGKNLQQISIYRTTSAYHGVMALILFVGYLYLVVHNLRTEEKGDGRVNLLWLLAIGIGVQFSWEFILLITGIRPPEIMPLLVNSLVETNMGMPYLYLIHRSVSAKLNQDLSPKIKSN
ncbi:MAG: hypothetical protein ACK2TW_08320 [Anaerolineales bacterium]